MSEVLRHLSLVDLDELDVGEERVVEKPVVVS
jgi:hypothetical protein